MMKIIEDLVESPTQENIELYFKEVNQIEYELLLEADKYPKKSQDYFYKRNEAFSVRSSCAIKLLNLWVKKYNSTDDCPVKYADTLNIPFRTIKRPDV